MRTHIAKWGNSLAVRLPRDIADEISLEAGTSVEIEVRAGTILLRRSAPSYTLAELLAGMSPEAMHQAFDWGTELGRETID